MKLEGARLVMLHGTIARLPVGEVCEVDARIEHDDDPRGPSPRKPEQGFLQVCRVNARELAIGQWKPRE